VRYRPLPHTERRHPVGKLDDGISSLQGRRWPQRPVAVTMWSQSWQTARPGWPRPAQRCPLGDASAVPGAAPPRSSPVSCCFVTVPLAAILTVGFSTATKLVIQQALGNVLVRRFACLGVDPKEPLTQACLQGRMASLLEIHRGGGDGSSPQAITWCADDTRRCGMDRAGPPDRPTPEQDRRCGSRSSAVSKVVLRSTAGHAPQWRAGSRRQRAAQSPVHSRERNVRREVLITLQES
jgi:hypothetical protein